MRTTIKTATAPANDRDRLALLWKAFEDAELRIAELESELDRGRVAARPSVVHETEHVVVRDERHVFVEELARAREERTTLQRRIDDAEERVRAADQARDRERMRAEAALHLHEIARAAHARDMEVVLRLQERLVTVGRDLEQAAQSLEAAQRTETELRKHSRDAAVAVATMEWHLSEAEDRADHERTARSDMEDRLSAQQLALGSAIEEAVKLREREQALVRELRDLTAAHADALRVIAWHQEMANAIHVEPAPAEAPVVPAPALPSMAMASRLYPVCADRVGAIPGIHEDETRSLRSVGINLVDAFLYADLNLVGRSTGMSVVRLSKLRSLAELLAVRGIGPAWAEALYRAGIRGIDEVASRSAEEIEAILLDHAQQTSEDGGYALAERTIPARVKAIQAECRRSASMSDPADG